MVSNKEVILKSNFCTNLKYIGLSKGVFSIQTRGGRFGLIKKNTLK